MGRITAHAVCTSETECVPLAFQGCQNNISNMEVSCPICGSKIQVWRMAFAIEHLNDEKVIADSVTWASEGESLIHTLIHVPESY